MDSKFNTSFIPKKSLQADTSTSPKDKYINRRATHYGPGFFLTFLIFIASIVGTVGVFGYTTIVNKRIDGYKTTLDEQQNRFDSSVVDELLRVESRIDNARELVVNHTVLTQLFSKIEAVTLRRIQYTELFYENVAGERPFMSLFGTAEDYKSVAQQTTVFRKDDLIHNPIMVELERNDTTEDVTFAVDTSVDEKLISFSAALSEGRFGKNTYTGKTNVSNVTNAAVTTNNVNVTADDNGVNVSTDNVDVNVDNNGATVNVTDGASETVITTSN